ncbi:hypothetical protein COO60DRAFT_491797 [Scenedesmus sp. NREL 46B-D3]|nr:hypothetical protein COO60DRAFT_491797 [Scenedesmus sp. NREL 46B-D3]
MLGAGWSLAADVLLRDGRLARAVLGGAGGIARRLQGASVQVSDEGEVALRLGLTVMAAPAAHSSHLPPPYGSSGTKAGEQQQEQQHEFELGVHLNLSQLIGVPSLQHADQLHAGRAGAGRVARGLLLVGDLGLEPEELSEMPWRAPSLGLGVLPVAPLEVEAQQPQQQQQQSTHEMALGKSGRGAAGLGGRAAERSSAGGGSSSSSSSGNKGKK